MYADLINAKEVFKICREKESGLINCIGLTGSLFENKIKLIHSLDPKKKQISERSEI